MSYFSEKLKSLRTLNGLTQDQFAQKLEISRSTIAMYETAEREPDFETLERISSALGVDAGTLLGDTAFCEDLNELFSDYQKLNDNGQAKARELMTELLNSPEYLK